MYILIMAYILSSGPIIGEGKEFVIIDLSGSKVQIYTSMTMMKLSYASLSHDLSIDKHTTDNIDNPSIYFILYLFI